MIFSECKKEKNQTKMKQRKIANYTEPNSYREYISIVFLSLRELFVYLALSIANEKMKEKFIHKSHAYTCS